MYGYAEGPKTSPLLSTPLADAWGLGFHLSQDVRIILSWRYESLIAFHIRNAAY